MKIAALILATAKAVMVSQEEVNMSAHIVTSTFGVEDEWVQIDQIIDHSTDDDHHDGGHGTDGDHHDGGHIHGGHCENIHYHYDSYLVGTEEWENSHWAECFDACIAADGVVEY